MTIQIGDKVTWTKTSIHGRAMSMVQRYGTVESITGNRATVRLRNNHKRSLPLKLLMVDGSGPNQLTQFVEAVFEANRKRDSR